jgi:putative Mg2+ transporter-C (MgtC) family protein
LNIYGIFYENSSVENGVKMGDLIWQELTGGLSDVREFVRVTFRLLAAMVLGAIVGLERESTGKPAGVRTYMLVALASALFVIVPLELGMPLAEVARIAQGVATGIGFIGAGAILKLSENREIQGLTTAAAIWMTAAVGMTVGLGGVGIGALSVTLAWVILAIIGRITNYLDLANEKQNPDARKGNASDPPQKKAADPNKEE